MALPHVLVTDSSELSPDSEEEARFEKKWGFCWNNADLNQVWERYRGTELLWDLSQHPEVTPFQKYTERGAYHWQTYQDVTVYHQRADFLVTHISRVVKQGRILDFGCGDGLFTNLVAKASCGEVIGIDLEEDAIKLAEQMTGKEKYEGPSPSFILGEVGPLPFKDSSFDAVYMLDVIEHLSNPAAVLQEVNRVLKEGGVFFLTTPKWDFHRVADPYHVVEYSPKELMDQLTRSGFRPIGSAETPPPYFDIIALAQK